MLLPKKHMFLRQCVQTKCLFKFLRPNLRNDTVHTDIQTDKSKGNIVMMPPNEIDQSEMGEVLWEGGSFPMFTHFVHIIWRQYLYVPNAIHK